MINIEFTDFVPSDSSKKIRSSIESFEEEDQGIWEIDSFELANLIKKIDQVQNKYSGVILCGIGGSALGPKMLKEALNLSAVDFQILENIDPDIIHDITKDLDLGRTLFLFISKSGGTPETLAQYLYFKNLYQEAGLELSQNFMIITDPEKSLLLDEARKYDIPHYPIPQNVGGRFSLQTSVGMIPLNLMGGTPSDFIAGFGRAKDSFYSTHIDKNLSYQLAEFQYKTNKPIQVILPYSTRLKSIGDWYAQLLGESIGKIDKNGKKVGLTPFSALGATDQHSQVQLWAEGPEDKAIIFIEVCNFDHEVVIPDAGLINSKTNFMINKTFNQLIQAEKTATQKALSEK